MDQSDSSILGVTVASAECTHQQALIEAYLDLLREKPQIPTAGRNRQTRRLLRPVGLRALFGPSYSEPCGRRLCLQAGHGAV